MPLRPSPLKHYLLMLVVIVSLLLALPTGCASADPHRQYAQLNDTFIAAVHVLVTARQDGVFDTEEWERDILPAIRLGDSLLTDYRAALDAGLISVEPREYLIQLLQHLQPFIIRATQRDAARTFHSNQEAPCPSPSQRSSPACSPSSTSSIESPTSSSTPKSN
jgi:hypothetical protein